MLWGNTRSLEASEVFQEPKTERVVMRNKGMDTTDRYWGFDMIISSTIKPTLPLLTGKIQHGL